ncbi:MAG: D-alanine--D-alanine ligase [Bacteroidetes bacterium]|nr:D-alanine--D-alanine ligase [Bacteroidota bacterium]
MRIGLIYDLFEDYPWTPGEPFDADVENEPVETVQALESAIRALGHVPVRIGPARNLLPHMDNPGFDVGLNIAEGGRGRNREGEAPALMEMMGVPFVGSDALTLSLSLDKAWTKDLAVAAGLRTPAYSVFSGDQIDLSTAPKTFPLFVKPRYEGSAKGLTARSKVFSDDDLRAQVTEIIQIYKQDALVEEFVEGSEFTVAVVGHRPPRTLPVIQRAVETETGIGLHVLDRKGLPVVDHSYALPGVLSPELEARLQAAALKIFHKLECRDFARVDFRVDAEGREWFLEINPLPTFAPDGTFAIMAELMGLSYPDFLAQVLREAIERVKP